MPTSRRRQRCRRIAKRRASSNFSASGAHGETLKLVSVTRMHDGSRLLVEACGEKHYVRAAAGRRISRCRMRWSPPALAIATGVDALKALDALADLKGASGRLELVGAHPSGAQVFVDYAHTPDALANALKALRPHAEGKLVVVFGAGGDRDPGKRPLMGAGGGRATPTALIVTDDNPRSEDPAAIRQAVLGGAPGAEEIGDRREAIRSAVAGLQAGRHPAHRRQGPRNRPDDRRQGAAVLRPGGGARGAEGAWERRVSALWTTEAFVAAAGGRLRRASRPPAIAGISIDSRTIAPGDAFVAIRGERFDGHDFVAAGAAGRRGARRGRAKGARRRRSARCSSCPTIRSPRWSGSARRRGRACTARSSPSPARSARPAPRRCSASRSRGSARRTRRSAPSTTIGACR